MVHFYVMGKSIAIKSEGSENRMSSEKRVAVKKAKKGILNILFSRVFLLTALVLLQIYVLAATVTFLQEYATYIYAGFLVLGVVTVIYMIYDSGNPDFKITWMLLIMITPIIGSVFYLFVKTQPGTTALQKRLSDLSKATKPYMLQDKDVLEDFRTSKPANANLATYMTNRISFPTHRNTAVTYFASGEEKFEELSTRLDEFLKDNEGSEEHEGEEHI